MEKSRLKVNMPDRVLVNMEKLQQTLKNGFHLQDSSQNIKNSFVSGSNNKWPVKQIVPNLPPLCRIKQNKPWSGYWLTKIKSSVTNLKVLWHYYNDVIFYHDEKQKTTFKLRSVYKPIAWLVYICFTPNASSRFCGILFEWIPRLSELYRICQSDEINRNRWDNLKIVLKGYQYITIDKRTRVPVHKRTHLRPPPLGPHIYMWWDIVRLSYISLRTSRHSFFPLNVTSAHIRCAL